MATTEPGLQNDPSALTFRVTIIEEIEAPEGEPRGAWYRYVIESKSSRITGIRRGSKQEVQCHAESFADDLNNRGNGRGYSSWAMRVNK